MKKNLFSVMAMTTMLFMASCSNDDLISDKVGNEAQVSFKVALNNGASSRTLISDGTKCDVLVMAVYDAGGNELKALRQEISPDADGNNGAFQNGLTQEVTVTLAKGQTYSFAFWAQDADCKAYNYSDLERIEIDYSNLKSNDDTRDAFCATKTLTVANGGFTDEPITLKRPFAQLNFGVSPNEWQNALNAGITVKSVKVDINEVYKDLNILTGEASGAVADITFQDNSIIYNGAENHEKLTLDLDGDGTTEDYYWLGMNYLLVNAKNTANATFTFTTECNGVARDNIVITSDNTPLQRNYRTNLIGRLTTEGSFQIEISPIYDGDINVDLETGTTTTFGVKNLNKQKTYQSIREALEDNPGAGNVIELAAGNYDVAAGGIARDAYTLKLDNSITIRAAEGLTARDVILNGQITVESGSLKNVTVTAQGTDCVIGSLRGTGVTMEGVTFNSQTGYFAYNDANGEVSDNNPTIRFIGCLFNGETPIQVSRDKAVVEDCSFEYTGAYCVKLAGNCELQFTGNHVGFANEERSFVNVADGVTATATFSGNTPEDAPKTSGDTANLTANIADGVSLSAGVYEISNANGMFWFNEQVNKNNNTFSGKTVKLIADVDLENKLWAPVGQTGKTQFMGTFDGGSKTISNLKVDTDASNLDFTAAGLFGWLNTATVKDVIIDKATVKGHYNAGTIAGYLEGTGCTVSGCIVKNAVVSCTYLKTNLEGDKAGGVIGFAGNEGTFVINCKIENSQIDAVRDAGQVVGAAKAANVTECSATSTTVTNNDSAPEGYAKNNTNINPAVIGRTL